VLRGAVERCSGKQVNRETLNFTDFIAGVCMTLQKAREKLSDSVQPRIAHAPSPGNLRRL